MSFGQATRKRFEQLRQMGRNVPKIMAEVAEGATIAAVERATELTPPNGASISGTGTRTGDLAQHWATDSTTTPVMTAGSARTTLANNMQYASYIDEGHRMDQHFVPGLHLDRQSNTIYFDVKEKGGIVVGTKTKYVRGRYMKQAAVGRYRKVVRMELDKRIRENFR